MPQTDRYKNRSVNIEFFPVEDFSNLPYARRFTIILVTSGTLNGLLNGHPLSIVAPGVLCLSEDDVIQINEKLNVAAQSFCYDNDFLNTVTLSDTQGFYPTGPRILTGLSLFQRDHPLLGVPRITEKAFPFLFDCFFILGMEVQAQSDSNWVCRIKKYLIQIMGLLEELSRTHERSPVDFALEYIHTNYSRKISLEDLTKCAHLNRVTLNKLFQERCGKTSIGYLLDYRLKVACDLLTHTDMKLNDIAHATGFEYDTYLIKQFKAKKGMSPTQYRIITRKVAHAQ
ncbi:helix-turn-helix domain-containing protein [Gorillibacterium timonense]|uniref:helix-turn-helix domain-containing protein n=1 Tax=Gorillibacterium timonense TaxID=1689269 RepID=UPI00071D3AFC|nr:AraC family transcriptional regulator [Gorillibacterium timonense]